MYMFSHMFRSCKNILTFVGWIFEFDGVKFRTLVFLFKLMLVDLQFVFFGPSSASLLKFVVRHIVIYIGCLIPIFVP